MWSAASTPSTALSTRPCAPADAGGVGGLLVEQLVGLAEGGKGDGDLLDRVGDGVEELLPGLCGAVGHGTAIYATWSPD
jgi:hypothetical protein